MYWDALKNWNKDPLISNLLTIYIEIGTKTETVIVAISEKILSIFFF